MMNQRKRSILFLLFTAGLFAGVLFCTETTQAKVKTTIKNGVCTVSGVFAKAASGNLLWKRVSKKFPKMLSANAVN